MPIAPRTIPLALLVALPLAWGRPGLGAADDPPPEDVPYHEDDGEDDGWDDDGDVYLDPCAAPYIEPTDVTAAAEASVAPSRPPTRYRLLDVSYRSDPRSTNERAATGHGGELHGAHARHGSSFELAVGTGTLAAFRAALRVERGAVHLLCEPSSRDLFCLRLEVSVDAVLASGGDDRVAARLFVTPTLRHVARGGSTLAVGVSAAAGGVASTYLSGFPVGLGGGALAFLDTPRLHLAATGEYLRMFDDDHRVKRLLLATLRAAVRARRHAGVDWSVVGRAHLVRTTERNRDVLFGGPDEDRWLELSVLAGVGAVFR